MQAVRLRESAPGRTLNAGDKGAGQGMVALGVKWRATRGAISPQVRAAHAE